MHRDSSVARPKIWGVKMFDFRRITLFCLGYRFSKHKITMCAENLEGNGTLGPLATPIHRKTVIISEAAFKNKK